MVSFWSPHDVNNRGASSVESPFLPERPSLKPSILLAVALAATYSIRTVGIRNARVRNESAVPRRLWAELQMLETALRQSPAARR